MPASQLPSMMLSALANDSVLLHIECTACARKPPKFNIVMLSASLAGLLSMAVELADVISGHRLPLLSGRCPGRFVWSNGLGNTCQGGCKKHQHIQSSIQYTPKLWDLLPGPSASMSSALWAAVPLERIEAHLHQSLPLNSVS